MIPSALVIGGAVVLVGAILLEGRRQERRYGKARGASLLRAGMLDLQRHLEPERKVEIFVEAADEDDASQSGDPPKPGGPGP
jgi:hypothetical protein